MQSFLVYISLPLFNSSFPQTITLIQSHLLKYERVLKTITAASLLQPYRAPWQQSPTAPAWHSRLQPMASHRGVRALWTAYSLHAKWAFSSFNLSIPGHKCPSCSFLLKWSPHGPVSLSLGHWATPAVSFSSILGRACSNAVPKCQATRGSL